MYRLSPFLSAEVSTGGMWASFSQGCSLDQYTKASLLSQFLGMVTLISFLAANDLPHCGHHYTPLAGPSICETKR
jgi:hypothetical protein